MEWVSEWVSNRGNQSVILSISQSVSQLFGHLVAETVSKLARQLACQLACQLAFQLVRTFQYSSTKRTDASIVIYTVQPYPGWRACVFNWDGDIYEIGPLKVIIRGARTAIDSVPRHKHLKVRGLSAYLFHPSISRSCSATSSKRSQHWW